MTVGELTRELSLLNPDSEVWMIPRGGNPFKEGAEIEDIYAVSDSKNAKANGVYIAYYD